MTNHPNRSRRPKFSQAQIAFLARTLKKISSEYDNEIAHRFYAAGLADELQYTNDEFARADFLMSATRESRWNDVAKI